MIRRPPRSTLFPYTDALPIFQRGCCCNPGGLVEVSIAAGCALESKLRYGRRLVGSKWSGARDLNLGQIGRASCRERSVDLGGRRIIKKKKRIKMRAGNDHRYE